MHTQHKSFDMSTNSVIKLCKLRGCCIFNVTITCISRSCTFWRSFRLLLVTDRFLLLCLWIAWQATTLIIFFFFSKKKTDLCESQSSTTLTIQETYICKGDIGDSTPDPYVKVYVYESFVQLSHKTYIQSQNKNTYTKKKKDGWIILGKTTRCSDAFTCTCTINCVFTRNGINKV